MKTSAAQLIHSFYERKQARNAGFSLGTLSRQSKISVSNLSRIFSGKRKLQLSHVAVLSKLLEIDELGQSVLRRQLLREKMGSESEFDSADAPVELKELAKEAPAFELAPETFHFLLEKWYYLAILELVTCEDFKFDAAWVAARLGISESIAADALERLVRRQCIAEVNGRWVKSSEKIRFPNGKEVLLYNRYQKENLRKANLVLAVVDEASVKERLVLGGTVAVNSRNLAKAREILNKAAVEALQVLCEGECDQVFQLTTLLIPVTKSKK